MKKLFIAVILLSGIQTMPLLAQNAVYLKSGRKVVCQNISLGPKNVTATVESKGVTRKKKYPNSSVKKALSDGIMKYSFRLNPESQKSMHIFASKIGAGKVNIYTFKLIQHTAHGQVAIPYLYLEKKDLGFEKVLPNNNKEAIRHQVKSFVGDDSEVLALLNSDDFKPRFKQIVNAVEQYNFNTYQPLEANHKLPSGNVCFYRDLKQQSKEAALIQIGEATYDLEKLQMKMVSIPAGRPLKVCVKNGVGDKCKLISASTEYLRFFEIDRSKKGEVKIKTRNQLEHNYFIKKYQTRNSSSS